MNLLRLAFIIIKSRPFRSGLVILFIGLVVFSAIWTTLIIQAVQANLRTGLLEMGKMDADIVVVRRGSSYTYIQPGNFELVHLADNIKSVPEVTAVASQVRLFTYENSPYCPEPEMYVYAFLPDNDFTVLPWLSPAPEKTLGYSEAYVGSSISLPAGTQTIQLAGIDLRVVSQLSQTGTDLDKSVFVSFITAKNLADSFRATKEPIAGLEANYVPVVMVKIAEGADPLKVTDQILADVAGVTAFESQVFFKAGRDQMTGLLDRLKYIFAAIWVLSILSIGVVFTISINERRRELGVLRVLGSTRSFLLRSILNEGLLLALLGGIPGVLLSLLGGFFFMERLTRALQLPPIDPSPLTWLVLAALSLLIAFISIILASIYPAWVVARQDPAVALRG